jgi:glycosyltransferase involved in cell wall biosynthesis
MTILQLIPWFPDKKNNHDITAGTFFKEQFKYIATKVNLIVVHINFIGIYDWVENYDRFFKIETIKIKSYTLYRITLPAIPKFHNLTYKIATFFVSKLLKYKTIDLIHTHVTLPTGVVAYYISKKYNIPYIITEHVSYFKTFTESKIFYKVAKSTTKYIAVSDFLKKDILDAGIENCIVLPNSIDIDSFVIKTKKNNEVNFVHISSLNKVKNFDSLIEAYKKLTLRYENTKLHVVGGGSNISKYKKLSKQLEVEDSIYFYGNLPNDRVKELLPSMDALVISSIKETFSVVGIEALASGVPVITTKCGGPEGYINNNVGIILNGFDSDSLLHSLEYFIQNKDKYDAKKIREYAIKNFDLKVIGEKYISLYKEIIGEHR